MSEVNHELTITIPDVAVDLRTNGDGFEYSRIKDMLVNMLDYLMQATSSVLIHDYGHITIEDKVVE